MRGGGTALCRHILIAMSFEAEARSSRLPFTTSTWRGALLSIDVDDDVAHVTRLVRARGDPLRVDRPRLRADARRARRTSADAFCRDRRLTATTRSEPRRGTPSQ